MRRPEVAVIVLSACAIAVAAVPIPAAGSIEARLQGTFRMRGQLTVVDRVRGEFRGEQVRRTWTFAPQCSTGACQRVMLQRLRSGRHILDSVVLSRVRPGLYVGHGRFWVALSCAGHVAPHGGLALETITVRITQVQLAGGVPYATALRATYVNPTRENFTRCPGGIGHDAARYVGQLSSSLP